MKAGQLVVDALASHGIDRVFCVPGESYLGLLDPLYKHPTIDTVVCRHEASAGFMALADARLTGLPGIACVSRGPGASNAAIAVHTAQQDGVPFILFIGQVPAQDVRRDSFQEIDYGHMFGKIAKWTAEVTSPDRMAETMLRALQVATTGLPGPVVIAVPEDVLAAECPQAEVMPQAPLSAAPSQSSLGEARHLLQNAKRPLVIAGSGVGYDNDTTELLSFLEVWNLPAVVSFRRQDLLPNTHRLYMGDMGLANPPSQMEAFREADALIVIGARLSDITTQSYSYPDLVRPKQTLMHVHADPTVIGTHFSCDVAIAAPVSSFFETIGTPPATGSQSTNLPDRTDWIKRLNNERAKITAIRHLEVSDGIPFELVVDAVGRNLPDNAIVTLDAGTFGAPVYRIVPFRPPQRLLAPISGAMGFGVPAAVAAGLRAPDSTVVCFVGDGGFLMTGGEMAVALERGLPLKVIVSENGIYASIRINQEKQYPGRPVGTSFVNPDFDLIGRAYGCQTTRIETLDQLHRIPELIAADGPQFIIVNTSVAAVLPR